MQDSIPNLNLRIRDYEILAVPTGIFRLDGGAMFGTVPKVLWEKTNPADHLNRIEMEARALLLKSHTHRILIDCGNGGHFIEKYGERIGGKFAEIYGVQSGTVNLENSLAKHGLKTSDITHVILTHLHFDHAGGATTFANGQIIPTFTNAKYFVQRANLETAQKPNVREKASYIASNFQPLLDSGQLALVDGDTDNILPGIDLRVSHGHTRGQQWVAVHDDKKGIVYCGDVIPTSTHVRLPFVMGYDLEPLLLIQEKEKLLGEVTKNGWFTFFEHDPFADCAAIEKSGPD
ncbi:MAG: MBL fold metallo-hydrolase [Bdellovibrionales bacterium]|nr:MBL fold metallo-hydrolase [Bdellovibrionales bacterium]